MKTVTVSGPQFPLLSILGIVFITLKLTGYIAWSWWWVLAPFWIPAVFALTIFVCVAIIVWLAKR